MIPGLMVLLATVLFCLTMLFVAWSDERIKRRAISKRDAANLRNRAFYGAIGEKWYPHRNEDGSVSHYPT